MCILYENLSTSQMTICKCKKIDNKWEYIDITVLVYYFAITINVCLPEEKYVVMNFFYNDKLKSNFIEFFYEHHQNNNVHKLKLKL
jgi:hypothetical protein